MGLVLELGASRQENVWEIFNLNSTEITQTRDILVEVSEEAATVEATTEHTRDHNTFVHLIGGRGPTQHRMGLAE